MDNARLSSLFCSPASAVIATPEMYRAQLWSDEKSYVQRSVEERQRQFAAGRCAARSALSHFGVKPQPLIMNSDGAPVWPSGFVGSISHCARVCAAVVGPSKCHIGMGIDVEELDSFAPEIERWICTATERSHFSQLPKAEWWKIAFSAKEAFYKSYYPIRKLFLDFCDVVIYFEHNEPVNEGTFKIEIDVDRAEPLADNIACFGKWIVTEGLVFTAVTIQPRRNAPLT
ncbi:MAG TPA: 4'-phosphopantetheinyl transferase superfamily protein [Rhizomicrobium sp.]|nr:4'-phosphopantetheinyl transferase superfamily protein [Rhizomicrobium sp.]